MKGVVGVPQAFQFGSGSGSGKAGDSVPPPPNLNRGANMCENTRGLE